MRKDSLGTNHGDMSHVYITDHYVQYGEAPTTGSVPGTRSEADDTQPALKSTLLHDFASI